MEFKCERLFYNYINYNSQERAKCANDPPERDFFKLMNNATYGKTIENVLKRTNFHLVTDEHKALTLSYKPNCVSWRIFEDDKLIGLQLRKTKVKIDKPFQVRTCDCRVVIIYITLYQ